MLLGDKGLVHVTTPGLSGAHIGELAALADHVSFNSLSQWRRFRGVRAPRAGWGLRVNPAVSIGKDARYDPCGRFPRLGAPIDVLADLATRTPAELAGLSGLLIHANCEGTDVTPLLQIVRILEDWLGPLLDQLRWVNLGGGYLLQDIDDLQPLHEAAQVTGLDLVSQRAVEPAEADD